MAQRLVRKLCEGKEEYKLEKNIIGQLKKYCDQKRIVEILKKEGLIKKDQGLGDISFFRPKATKTCPEGYKGRIGIFEVLPVTETIKRLITKEEVSSDEIQKRALQEGMMTMIEDGLIKAARGITSIEEVLRVIME